MGRSPRRRRLHLAHHPRTPDRVRGRNGANATAPPASPTLRDQRAAGRDAGSCHRLLRHRRRALSRPGRRARIHRAPAAGGRDRAGTRVTHGAPRRLREPPDDPTTDSDEDRRAVLGRKPARSRLRDQNPAPHAKQVRSHFLRHLHARHGRSTRAKYAKRAAADAKASVANHGGTALARGVNRVRVRTA